MTPRRAWVAAALAGVFGLAAPASAQPQRRHRIGILFAGDRSAGALFEAELAQRGYVEGRNLAIDRREALGDISRLPALAAELVALQPDAIFTIAGTPGARAAKAATDRIPIVFEASGDPVLGGLVASLNKPGGQLTGSAIFTRTLDNKRIQLLAEVLPRPTRLAVLDTLRRPEQRASWTDPLPAIAGVTFELFEFDKPGELQATFQRIAQWRATGLVVMHTPRTASNAPEIARLAVQYRLPGIGDGDALTSHGLMLSYTTDFSEGFRTGAEYIARILAGARPSDLPVVQINRLDLVVNMKTARELALTIPRSLLLQATRVIE